MNTQRCMTSTRILATACVLALVLGCNSDESPFTPEPVHYNIYGTGSNYLQNETTSRMYWYNADSLTLVDSLVLPHIALWGEASPDGRYLYLVMWPYRTAGRPYYIMKLDIERRTEVWTHDAEGYDDYSPFRILDNGRLLVYGREVIDALTGETVHRLEDSVINQWKMYHGPPGGREVAAVSQDTVPNRGRDTMVVAMNVLTGEHRGRFVPRIAPGQPALDVGYARLHPDGHRVLCTGAVLNVQNAWFVIGDLNTGEQLLTARLSTPNTEIAISHDGTLAVVVDYANLFFGYGWPAAYVYDLVDYQHLYTFDSYNSLATVPGQVRFLPGDRRVVIFPDNGPTGHGWIQILDLTTLTSEVAIEEPFRNAESGAIVVAPRPLP